MIDKNIFYVVVIQYEVSSEKFINHRASCKTDINKLDTSPVSFKHYGRSSLRDVLMLDMTEKCANYDKFEEKVKSLVTKQLKNLNNPGKLKAPFSETHSSRLKLVLQNERLNCPLLEEELETMRNEMETKAVNSPSDIISFINNTMDNDYKLRLFMKHFWE